MGAKVPPAIVKCQDHFSITYSGYTTRVWALGIVAVPDICVLLAFFRTNRLRGPLDLPEPDSRTGSSNETSITNLIYQYNFLDIANGRRVAFGPRIRLRRATMA